MSKHDNLRLREANVTPTSEVMRKVLGSSYDAYAAFQRELAGLELEQVWQYYMGCTKSWMARGQYKWTTPRGTNKEKTIYWLSVWDGYFKVTVWFLEKNRFEILKADVSEKTKQVIRGAKTLGKMNTFPVEFDVTDAKPLADICELIKYKKRLEA